jgi:hypothetical protein
MKNPTVFISYSWDDERHKEWVRDLAARMRSDGIDVKLDQWEAVPGDQLPKFMEQSIRENDFVLVICTSNYKRKSDNREGGVGYEGDIMTAEVHTTGNHRKFIPVMRRGPWIDASPSWLLGKYHVDLTGEPYGDKDYDDLLATLYGRREKAPPLGPIPAKYQIVLPAAPTPPPPRNTEQQDITIKGIVIDEVSEPRGDGTLGSALYKIPFQLSRRPSPEWTEVFLHFWDKPPQFTTMHRPGIASVVGDKIILDGTTIEEVQRYHRETLVLVVARTNEECHRLQVRRQQIEKQKEVDSLEHKKKIQDLSKKINFD